MEQSDFIQAKRSDKRREGGGRGRLMIE